MRRTRKPRVDVIGDFVEIGVEYPFTTIEMKLSHFRALQVDVALWAMGLSQSPSVRSSLRLLAVVRRTREIEAIGNSLGSAREEILESIIAAVQLKLNALYPDKGQELVRAAMAVLQVTRDLGPSPATQLVNRAGRTLAERLAAVLSQDVIVEAGFGLPKVQQPALTDEEVRGAQIMEAHTAKRRQASSGTRTT